MSTEKVMLVSHDPERNRPLYWNAKLDRFTYYNDAATVFDSADEAQIYMKYAGITKGELKPA